MPPDALLGLVLAADDTVLQPAAPADRLTEHTWQRPAARPAPEGGAA
ncbi:hypothetical protein [Streptomyces achromogenes]